MKSSFFNFSASYGSIIVIFCEHLPFFEKINFYQHIRITSGAASRWLCTRFFQEIFWHIMVLFFWITIFKILAIVIIALPISGLLFPKNPTWKLSNFLKFLLSFQLEKLETSLTRFVIVLVLVILFSKGRKVKLLSHLWINHPEIWWASPINDYLQVL